LGPYKKDKKLLASVEMIFFRIIVGYALSDHKRHEDILEELKAEPGDEKLRRHKSHWLRHVTRMNSSRMLKIMLNYRPNGRRRLGRPFKRILDKAEAGLSRSNL
jgi:hypothetical protein